MAKRDYYEVLNVRRDASADEIKSAFRNMARQYHPDINKDPGAEESFKEINEAFAILSDPDKRAAYDRYGHEGLNGMGGMPDFTNIDLTDIFEGLFGFGGMGGMSGARQRNAPRRGQDLGQTIEITFEEAAFGVEKEIQITRDETCSVCRGTKAEPGTHPQRCGQCEGRGEIRQVRQTFLGSMVQVVTCPTCSGSGEIISSPCKNCRGRGLERKTSTKTVPIPAGVDQGTQIRLAGEGQPGINNGQNGNFYLEVQVKPHQYFRRKKDDVYLDVNLNIAQATLGADIEVPTLYGMEKISVPAGTQPGRVFTLRGMGMQRLRSSGKGDQVVMVNVQVPTKVSPEQRVLLEQLAETLGSEVKPEEKGFFDKLKDVFGG